MRPYLIGFIGSVALWPLAAECQQKVDVRKAAAPDISVRISGTVASLRIVGTAVDSLIVTGTLPNAAHFQSFQGGKGQEPLMGAKLYVDVPGDQAAAGGMLEVRVPARARVWAKAGNATIDATGVTGGLDLNIVGGSVRVSSSPRECNIESMDGAVSVEGEPSWLRVKTAAGDITMRGSSEDVALTTVSGTIHVGTGKFDRARFESVTGAIDFSGDPVRAGTLTFDTHSGKIDLRFDPNEGLDIEATSIAGTIENLLTKKKPQPGRDGRGQELTTSTGQAEARVTVRTFKGAIRLMGR
jgi:hypothetical protein